MLALENVIAEQEQIELVEVSEGKPLAYWMHWPRRKKEIEKDGSVSGLAIQRILQRSILYLAEPQKMTPVDVSRKSCGRYLVTGWVQKKKAVSRKKQKKTAVSQKKHSSSGGPEDHVVQH